MKALVLVVAISINCVYLYAQDKGIRFEQGTDWEKILAKAKKENKAIFVDCYTTWCGPCKEMEKSTYPNEKLGNFFNEKFISIKLQMDTSKSDDALVKKRYATAHAVDQKYSIGVYPSFLFFSPDGTITHRFFGYLVPDDMINLGKEALDINRQYYTLLEKYNKHSLDANLMPYLAIKADVLGDKMVSNTVAKDYLENHWFRFNRDQLLTPENLLLMDRFTRLPSDKSFTFFRENTNRIDSILGAGRAGKMLIRVITAGEIVPALHGRQPSASEWQALEKKYGQKYGFPGKMAILYHRLYSDWIVWKNWKDYGKIYVRYFQDIGQLNVIHINNASFDVFLHVTDPEVVSFAIQVMFPHKEDDIQAMDTYACLLYKAGRVKEAIAFEQKIADLEEKSAHAEHRETDNTYLTNVGKMKEGKKIWIGE